MYSKAINDSYSEEVQLCLGELTLGGLIRTVKDVVGVWDEPVFFHFPAEVLEQFDGVWRTFIQQLRQQASQMLVSMSHAAMTVSH